MKNQIGGMFWGINFPPTSSWRENFFFLVLRPGLLMLAVIHAVCKKLLHFSWEEKLPVTLVTDGPNLGHTPLISMKTEH